MVDLIPLDYFSFVTNIVKKGITSTTYSTRAEIIMCYLDPEIRSLEYDTKLAICDTTVGNVINKLFIDFPSLKEVTECSSNVCLDTLYMNYNFITIQTDMESNIGELQQYLNYRTNIEEQKECKNGNCDGIKKTKSVISKMHLFIDILFWEGNSCNKNILIEVKQLIFFNCIHLRRRYDFESAK